MAVAGVAINLFGFYFPGGEWFAALDSKDTARPSDFCELTI